MPDVADRSIWRECARLEDLVEGKGRSFEVEGQFIALFLYGGKVEAIEARCPHASGPLDRGWLDGNRVICPLHRWKFDITTGHCLTVPEKSIRHFPTKVDDAGAVWVDLAI